MTETVTERNSYSAAELAAFRLPGFPTARKNWYPLVAKLGWEVVPRRGRGPGGITRTFVPPPEVQALIDARRKKLSELAPAASGGSLRRPSNLEAPCAAAYEVNGGHALAADVDTELLAACVAACSLVHGQSYDAAPVSEQVRAAADLYNALLNMANTFGSGRQRALRLGTAGTANQLRLLLQMGVLRAWPESDSGDASCGNARPGKP